MKHKKKVCQSFIIFDDAKFEDVIQPWTNLLRVRENALQILNQCIRTLP